MNHFSDLRHRCTDLHRKSGFMDEVGDMGTEHVYAENSPARIFHDNFTYAGDLSCRLRLSQCGIAEAADLQR